MVRNTDPQIMVAAQCRAARALLQITQVELASLTGLSKDVIVRFEAGRGDLHRNTLDRIALALAEKGVVFVHDHMSAGAKLRRDFREKATQEVLTPVQCRAARAVLHISAATLASLVRMNKARISDYELGRQNLNEARLLTIRASLVVQGVMFISEPGFVGVRLRGLPRELEKALG